MNPKLFAGCATDLCVITPGDSLCIVSPVILYHTAGSLRTQTQSLVYTQNRARMHACKPTYRILAHPVHTHVLMITTCSPNNTLRTTIGTIPSQCYVRDRVQTLPCRRQQRQQPGVSAGDTCTNSFRDDDALPSNSSSTSFSSCASSVVNLHYTHVCTYTFTSTHAYQTFFSCNPKWNAKLTGEAISSSLSMGCMLQTHEY